MTSLPVSGRYLEKQRHIHSEAATLAAGVNAAGCGPFTCDTRQVSAGDLPRKQASGGGGLENSCSTGFFFFSEVSSLVGTLSASLLIIS